MDLSFFFIVLQLWIKIQSLTAEQIFDNYFKNLI